MTTKKKSTHDDDMPAEIDFSTAERGKFYHPNMKVNLPVYLEAQVQRTLTTIAKAKGVELSVYVNDLLKKDIEIIQISR